MEDSGFYSMHCQVHCVLFSWANSWAMSHPGKTFTPPWHSSTVSAWLSRPSQPRDNTGWSKLEPRLIWKARISRQFQEQQFSFTPLKRWTIPNGALSRAELLDWGLERFTRASQSETELWTAVDRFTASFYCWAVNVTAGISTGRPPSIHVDPQEPCTQTQHCYALRAAGAAATVCRLKLTWQCQKLQVNTATPMI